MLRIFIREGRRWNEIPNGPFPITEAQLEQARAEYRMEWARCAPLEGVRQAPQTTARDILKRVAPHLSDFDVMMLGFAVSTDRVRIE